MKSDIKDRKSSICSKIKELFDIQFPEVIYWKWNEGKWNGPGWYWIILKKDYFLGKNYERAYWELDNIRQKQTTFMVNILDELKNKMKTIQSNDENYRKAFKHELRNQIEYLEVFLKGYIDLSDYIENIDNSVKNIDFYGSIENSALRGQKESLTYVYEVLQKNFVY